MKEVSHKILSIAMALLLLLSTTSWKVEKHYCMGRLMNISLFSDVDSCGMDMGSMTIENDDTSENSCCDDEVLVIEGQDDLKLSFENISFNKQQFLVAYTVSYICLFEDFGEQQVLQNHYPPPLIVKDIQLLDEAFLI